MRTSPQQGARNKGAEAAKSRQSKKSNPYNAEGKGKTTPGTRASTPRRPSTRRCGGEPPGCAKNKKEVKDITKNIHWDICPQIDGTIDVEERAETHRTIDFDGPQAEGA